MSKPTRRNFLVGLLAIITAPLTARAVDTPVFEEGLSDFNRYYAVWFADGRRAIRIRTLKEWKTTDDVPVSIKQEMRKALLAWEQG